MTTWILIWMVMGTNTTGSPATGSAVFHNQAACEKAAAYFNDIRRKSAMCFEDGK